MAMTITRALSEIKLLDKRIAKSNAELIAVDATKPRGKVTLVKRIRPEDVTEASFTSLMDLINRRELIKGAIVQSNAKTSVQIGQRSMTVASAIEAKASIVFKKAVLQNLKNQLQQAREIVDVSNQQMELQAIKSAEAAGNKRDSKDTAEDFTAFVEAFRKNNTAELLNPLKVEEKIKTLETEVEEFESNVDFALSESNAKTTIDV